jgi:hypothetical protein
MKCGVLVLQESADAQDGNLAYFHIPEELGTNVQLECATSKRHCALFKIS